MLQLANRFLTCPELEAISVFRLSAASGLHCQTRNGCEAAAPPWTRLPTRRGGSGGRSVAASRDYERWTHLVIPYFDAPLNSFYLTGSVPSETCFAGGSRLLP